MIAKEWLELLKQINPMEHLLENFKEMEEIVLSYPKIQERIKARPEDKTKVLKNLKEMRSELSMTFLKSFETFLDNTLIHLYDGIKFKENETALSHLLDSANIVLVPNHQSHADYVAINYIFFKNYKRPLFVAGGNNLNIFPIGTLFRKSGCFFIRRTFANDILYKLTLEAYLYFMLYKGMPIEFFFEGGRSRTGKLLPPRFGLYQMIIEAHQALRQNESLPQELKKPLKFVPVSIMHEYVPEQKSLIKEADGAKKKKESATQVFSLVKLFSYQFGNVHINLGRPVEISFDLTDLKHATQRLAFDCFFEVGKNMRVTPTSLLSMILLDEPRGAMTWSEILNKAILIRNYCQKFNVPLTDSLSDEHFEKALERSIDILIGNKKVNAIGNYQGTQIFYSIIESSRKEVLYFKNTILHHFLVPWIIYLGWVNLFSGKIKDVDDLKRFFLNERKKLSHEFYLPTVKEFLNLALSIISDAIGREVKSLKECMELTHPELYLILTKVTPFARSCHYLMEAYYISGLTLKELSFTHDAGFKMDTYTKRYKEIFENHLKMKGVIQYPESYSLALSRSSLDFFIHSKMAQMNAGYLNILDVEKIDEMLSTLEANLLAKIQANLLGHS